MNNRSKEQFWERAQCNELHERSDSLNSLAMRAFAVTEDFDITKRFSDWQQVYGIEYDEQTVGFGAYMQYKTDAGIILYEDLKVVDPEFQGLGIGAALTKQAVVDLNRRSFSPIHVLARTQNVHEIGSLKKGVSQAINRDAIITPIESTPDKTAQHILQLYLDAHPTKRGTTDIQTFISHAAYRSGDMTANFSDGSVDIVDQYLTKHDASKENGDALFVLTSHIGAYH